MHITTTTTFSICLMSSFSRVQQVRPGHSKVNFLEIAAAGLFSHKPAALPVTKPTTPEVLNGNKY